jgi:rhamnose transport system substrate-binding protein
MFAMRTTILMLPIALLLAGSGGAFAQSGQSGPAPATATPGKALNMEFVPKFLSTDKYGKLFDEAHQGAVEAAKELQNPGLLLYTAPIQAGRGPSQSEIVTAGIADRVKAIMMSNSSGDQVVPALKAARAKGAKVVTWDSPIPSAEGEDVYIAQVDFSQAGQLMADMALNSLGPDGGKLAILSTFPDAPFQNAAIATFDAALKQPKYAKLEQVDLAYGNDDPEQTSKQVLALADKHPDLKLILIPTSTVIVPAAQALQDKNLCNRVKVGGFGLPSEMGVYTRNGCAAQYAQWSFVDLGYLAYYTAYLLATDAIKAEPGQQFMAGRMGKYTIVKDPGRPRGLRVLMGPWAVYDKANLPQIP